MNGETAPAAASTRATVRRAAAQAAALRVTARAHQVPRSTLHVSRPSLWLLDPSLLGAPTLPGTRPVWRTTVTSTGDGGFREYVFVDARNGRVSLHFDQNAELTRVVCDRANNPAGAEDCTGGYTRSEGGAASTITDVNDAYNNAGYTSSFYQNRLGVDLTALIGFNSGDGKKLRSTTRYCPDASVCPYPNANWTGKGMVYGKGFASADDVVGHELSHGVTEHTSGLFYYYQSGAINESLSDVFGELTDQDDGHGVHDSAGDRWKLGEDLPPSIGVVRNMRNPPLFHDPDRMQSSLYAGSTADSGGVHSNSGVNNKAAFLIDDGGTFNGRTVVGLGLTKTANIYFQAEKMLTSGSDYRDLYFVLPQACRNLVTNGVAGMTSTDCTSVSNAVAATEMNVNPVVAGGRTNTAPTCPTGTAAISQFSESFEADSSVNWNTAGNGWWGFSNQYAHTGIWSLASQSLGTGSGTASSTMPTRVTLPAGRTSYLRFDDAYTFYSDSGGHVSYSTDNGASWHDLGSRLTSGGYNASIPQQGGGTRAGFGGISHGWTSSRADLSSFKGQSFKVRFTDSSASRHGGGITWFIDDVKIYSCA
jgi:bacillolysin